MSGQTSRRHPSAPSSSSASQTGPSPNLATQSRNHGDSRDLKAPVPGIHGSYTLSRGPNLRPLQFEGELVAEAEKDAINRNGRRNERGPVTHRAAIYKTRRGTFVTEFSSLDHTGKRTGKADAFGSLDE